MKPVHQTSFFDPSNPDHRGNCLQAAVASIMELELDQVPNFMQMAHDHGQSWFMLLLSWVQGGGWNLRSEAPTSGPYLVCGPSPRGETGHAVVFDGGVMVHDPHPDGTGLVGDPDTWTVLVLAP